MILHAVTTRVGIGVYDEAWFDWRLRLLEAITAPSLAAQTDQEFTWLVIVDRDMPAGPRRRLDRIVGRRAEILTAEHKTALVPALRDWLRQRLGDADHVLTTRLDDDDAMHTRTVELTHDALPDYHRSGATMGMVSFNLGCMWVPTARRGYSRYHHSLGLGLTLIEPPGETVDTVWSRKHLDIKHMLAPRGTYYRDYAGATPWWLYTTHGLASSDTGDDARTRRVTDHRYGYHVDDAMLATFGLDPAAIDQLATTAEPRSAAPLKGQWTRGMSIELEMAEVRSQLEREPDRDDLRQRLDELDQQRRESGTGLIRTR